MLTLYNSSIITRWVYFLGINNNSGVLELKPISKIVSDSKDIILSPRSKEEKIKESKCTEDKSISSKNAKSNDTAPFPVTKEELVKESLFSKARDILLENEMLNTKDINDKLDCNDKLITTIKLSNDSEKLAHAKNSMLTVVRHKEHCLRRKNYFSKIKKIIGNLSSKLNE